VERYHERTLSFFPTHVYILLAEGLAPTKIKKHQNGIPLPWGGMGKHILEHVAPVSPSFS